MRHQDSHKELEQKLAGFPGWRCDLDSSCFDANGGLFESCRVRKTPLSPMHSTTRRSSMVCVCGSKRYRYANNDMQELEARLKEAREAGACYVLIATDGVFSTWIGVIANLKAFAICR
ncbi:hypothetical protein ACNKHT_23810 [Shigella flexneri]